jgi:hypothetical protein
MRLTTGFISTVIVLSAINIAVSKDSGGSNQTKKTSVAEDKNWGDKQTKKTTTTKDDKINTSPPPSQTVTPMSRSSTTKRRFLRGKPETRVN